MKHFVLLFLGTMLVFSFTGCQSTEGDNIDRNKEINVSFRVLGGTEMPERISGWIENNKEIEQAMLVEDQGKYFVVVTRGRKNTGGYGVEIKNMNLHLVEGNSTLQVNTKYIDPAPGVMVTQALTYPYVVAQVDLKEKPVNVRFEIDEPKE